MITTETKETKEVKRKDYPKLMQSQTSGAIYLMNYAGVGTRLTAGNSNLLIGEHNDCLQVSDFIDFKGSVELKSN